MPALPSTTFIAKYILGYDQTEEMHTNVGSSPFTINHDYFLGDTDLEIWTGTGKTGTQLVETTDYDLGGENTRLSTEATTAAGSTKYVMNTIQVTNATYQTGNLYFNVKYIGDIQSAADMNDHEDRLKALENVLYIEHQVTSGTNGGTLTASTWNIRPLNTVVINEIDGASLASNQITLPAGTYYVEFEAPGFYVNGHKAKLYDTTGAADLIIGSNAVSGSGTNQDKSFGRGRFTLSVESDLELRHNCATTRADTGMGAPMTFGVVEVYAKVWIRKLA